MTETPVGRILATITNADGTVAQAIRLEITTERRKNCIIIVFGCPITVRSGQTLTLKAIPEENHGSH